MSISDWFLPFVSIDINLWEKVLRTVVVYLAIAILGALMFRRFPFGRAEHEARLARLAGAAIVDAAPREP